MGDIHLEAGSYVLIGDTIGSTGTFSAAVAQTIRNRFLFFKSEWFLNTAEGVPWIQSILAVKSPDLSAIRSLFSRLISETAGVSSLVSIELNFDRSARSLTVAFKANLEEGTLLDSAEFAPFILEV